MDGHGQNDNNLFPGSGAPSYDGQFMDGATAGSIESHGGGYSIPNTYQRPNSDWYVPVAYPPHQGPPPPSVPYTSGLPYNGSASDFAAPSFNPSFNGYPPQSWEESYDDSRASMFGGSPPPMSLGPQQTINPLVQWGGMAAEPSAIASLYKFGVDNGSLQPLSKGAAKDTGGAESNVETQPETGVETEEADAEGRKKRDETEDSTGSRKH
ncbi:hypothetical protein IAT38_000235 [Cryptococcus sp. DSM 104549]